MLKAEFDNYFQTETFRTNEKNTVECSLNLSEDNADKIISLTGKVYQATFEKEEDTLVYGGLAAFNVVFSGDELMRTEVGAKFSFKTKLPVSGCTVENVCYTLSDVRVKTEGGMLYAIANLFTEIIYRTVKENPYLVATDALSKKGSLKKFTEKSFSGNFDAEDTFDVKKIKRILFSDANAVVKSVTAGADAVTAEGTAVISVLMLPFSENGDIIKEQRVLPFRFECDAEGAGEGMNAAADVAVDKLSLKVYVDEEKNRTTVSVKVGLHIYGDVVRCDEQEYIEDCYSVDSKLDLTHSVISMCTVAGVGNFSDRVSGIANCSVPEYSRLIKLTGETTELADVTLESGMITANGLLSGTAIFAGEDNAFAARPFQLPFSVSTRTDAEKVDNVRVIAEEVFGKMRNGSLDVDAGVIVSYTEYEEHSFDVLSDFAEGERKDAAVSAISVYLGAEGDTEWDVTKRLGVASEEILAENPDITFPLTGGERVTVFRKLR